MVYIGIRPSLRSTERGTSLSVVVTGVCLFVKRIKNNNGEKATSKKLNEVVLKNTAGSSHEVSVFRESGGGVCASPVDMSSYLS